MTCLNLYIIFSAYLINGCKYANNNNIKANYIKSF